MRTTVEISKEEQTDSIIATIRLDGRDINRAIIKMFPVESVVLEIAEQPNATPFQKLDALATLQGAIERVC